MPSALRRGFKASIFAAPLALGALLSIASPARADSDEGFDKKGDDAIAADKNAREEKEKGDKMPGEKEKPPPAVEAATAPDPKYDPLEEQGTRYNFVGLRFRDVIVPKFMINWFADGGATVNVAMFGPELSTRKNRTEFDFAVQYADYSMNPFMFKPKSDPDTSYEIVSSSLKMILFTTDILYDVPLDKTGKFSFLVGAGVGFGVVFGNLYQNQAYPADGSPKADPGDVSQWRKCSAPDLPTSVTTGNVPYCNDKDKNGHFGDFTTPSWANGGSKPNIFPWISLPQLSLRYKPIKQLQTRFDTGFSTSGFFFGLSAGYGL